MPLAAARADEEWITVSTPHFTIEAVNDHAPQASWYAAFVEQVHEELSDLLAVSLDRPIRVRLYPTEEAYVAANPVAAGARGILAHAQPKGDEIGLALVRLEALPGPSRVAAFRHELAHLLLDIRSGRRLPISFQEGIAQYLEQDPNTDADTLAGLRRAYSTGQLLSWADLNRPSIFIQQPNVSYPESHAVVAYLIERHGLGAVGKLLDALREGQDLTSATQTAYGVSGEPLEQDWRGTLPAVMAGGLPRNVLANGNLRPAQQAASEERWAEAGGQARVAEQFWMQLGNTGRATEARTLADLADAAVVFRGSFEQARRGMDERRYREAIAEASGGIRALPASADPAYRSQLEAIVERAEAGIIGEESLAAAGELMSAHQIIEAQRVAGIAEQQLTLAGDEARAYEARELRAQAQQLQQMLATAALAVALLFGGGLWLSRARTPAPVSIRTSKPEIQL